MNESLQLLHAVRFSVGFLGLALAALLDLRTRRVPNKVWWVMGTAAALLWLAEMHLRERPWEHYALLGPLLVFFAYAFIDPTDWPWDGKRLVWHGLEGASIIGLIYLGYRRLLPFEDMDWDFAGLLAVPLLMGLMVGAYYAGVMVGGADVKALMTVALLAPTTSELVPWDLWVASDTVGIAMPFVIFGNSMLCYLIIPLVFLIWNLAHRHGGPPWAQMLFGFNVPIAKARKMFIWPMERWVPRVPQGAAEHEAEADDENGDENGDGNDEEENEDSEEDHPEGNAPMHERSDLEDGGYSEAASSGERISPEGPNEPASVAVEDPNINADDSSPGEHTEGRILFEFLPKNRHDTQEVLDDLEAAGRTEVWVTPKTPFMVPLAAAWVVSHLVGDIFFSLFIW